MCSEPVTFGGGIDTTYGSRESAGSVLARNTPCSSQKSYQRGSTSAGSYALGKSVMGREAIPHHSRRGSRVRFCICVVLRKVSCDVRYQVLYLRCPAQGVVRR